jgi:hypothetical protein
MLDDQLHRLHRLSLIVLAARERPRPLLLIDLHAVWQRRLGRGVVANQTLTACGRQARLERPEGVPHGLVRQRHAPLWVPSVGAAFVCAHIQPMNDAMCLGVISVSFTH